MYIVWILCGGVLGGLISLYYSHQLCGLKYRDYINIVLYPCIIPTIIIVLIGYLPQFIFTQSYLRLCITITTTSICFVIINWKLLSSEEKKIITELTQKYTSKFLSYGNLRKN